MMEVDDDRDGEWCLGLCFVVGEVETLEESVWEKMVMEDRD